MLFTLFLVLYVLIALSALLINAWKGFKIILFLLFIFLLSLGGLFILFNNIFVGAIYFFTATTILLSMYICCVDVGHQSVLQCGRPLTFLHSSVYVTFVIYLFFILLTIVFSGGSHHMKITEGFGLLWIDASRLKGELVAPLILVAVIFLMTALGMLSHSRKRA